MVKHLIILISINNIYKLEEAFKVLLEELLRIADITVLKRKLNIGITVLQWDNKIKRAVKDVRKVERKKRTQRFYTVKKELKKAKRYKDKVISKV